MALYTIKHDAIVVSTAITIMQYKAGAANPAYLVRVAVSQGLSETSTQEQCIILRKTAAATVTSFTPLKNDPDSVAAFGVGGTAATGITATAEGTDGDILVNDGWNILNNFLWVRSCECEIKIPAGGILAVKFPVAPASATWRAYMVVEEL